MDDTQQQKALVVTFPHMGFPFSFFQQFIRSLSTGRAEQNQSAETLKKTLKNLLKGFLVSYRTFVDSHVNMKDNEHRRHVTQRPEADTSGLCLLQPSCVCVGGFNPPVWGAAVEARSSGNILSACAVSV